jgi:hypothetical protein
MYQQQPKKKLFPREKERKSQIFLDRKENRKV